MTQKRNPHHPPPRWTDWGLPTYPPTWYYLPRYWYVD